MSLLRKMLLRLYGEYTLHFKAPHGFHTFIDFMVTCGALDEDGLDALDVERRKKISGTGNFALINFYKLRIEELSEKVTCERCGFRPCSCMGGIPRTYSKETS